MNYAEDRLDRRARQGSLQNDFIIALETANHELLARTLRDNGWNIHAIFHYGMQWMKDPEDIKASMDYCQMLELSGYPWNALLALLAFRNQSPILEPTIQQVELNVSFQPDQSWLRQSHDAMKGRNCGCGLKECGQQACFDCIVDHSTVVTELNTYFATQRNRYHPSNGISVPTANDVHRQLSLNSQAIEMAVEPSIPHLLKFWTPHQSYRTGSPLWQMLAIKLFFLTIPPLAIEAAVCTNLDATDWKSHRAFYIFIKALSLGERIKPHRIARLSYWHIPLWDRLWRRAGAPIYCPQSLGLDTGNLWHEATKGCASTFPNLIPEALHIVGDSHVLSLAWQVGEIDGRSVVFVPVLITGLKAWHTRPQTQFFTHTCLVTSLRRIPSNVILLSAGEIDCREGMGGPLLEGYTEDCLPHVKNTVQEYVESISLLAKSILIMPVAPHLQRPAKGRAMGQASRRQTMREWNLLLGQQEGFLDFVGELCDDEYRLKHIFNADGTHLNSAALPLVLRAISRNQLWRGVTDERPEHHSTYVCGTCS